MSEAGPAGNDRENTGIFSPIRWMVENHIAPNLLMIILLVGGVWMYFNIQKEMMPEATLDIVTVSVRYPGTSPTEVEQGVLLPVEEALQGLQGVKEMTSTAREGSGRITLELLSGVNRQKVYQDIEQEVNRIRTFPEDAEEPEVDLRTIQRDVMEVGIYGDVSSRSLRKLAERLRDTLLQHSAITQLEISHVPEYVTHADISQKKLRAHNLTLSGIARQIENSSRDFPAGDIETANGELLLRIKERRKLAEEFSRVPIITTPAGAQLTLADLGEVNDGFEESAFYSGYNGKESVQVEIFRVGKQSPLEIAAAVKSTLAEFKQSLPRGVKVRIDSNHAEMYGQRLSLLGKNGLIGMIIVLCVLSLFLEIRLALWVMMGMAVSFVGAFLFLPLWAVSFNMVSMFAFLVVLGIVVDDAIVVGENVYEYRRRGYDLITAAVKGTQNIAGPVVFSILTNIVAFVPLMFIPGVMGKFWWPIPAVVITVLLISLLEALYILPAHLAHTSEEPWTQPGQVLHNSQQKFAAWFHWAVNKYYRPLLEVSVANRYVVLVLAVVLLGVVGGYATSDHMSMIMMPEVGSDEIEAGATLPEDTTRKRALEVARELSSRTLRMFEEHNLQDSAEGVSTHIWGTHVEAEIIMNPPGERKMSVREVAALWRREVGDIPGVQNLSFETSGGPGGWRDDISVDLSHSDIETLEQASQVFFRRLEEFDATRDVNDNYELGKRQFDFHLLPAGRRLGLTATEVGRQVRSSFYGVEALTLLRGTNEVEVRAKLPETERDSLYDLRNLMIHTSSGGEIPLYDIAKVKKGRAYTSIDRRNGRRIINVGGDVEPRRETSRVLTALKQKVLPRIRDEFPGLTWTFEGMQAEMRESTQTLWGGFILAMLVVYGLLAIAFESYIQPFIVMAGIPFGIIGAVLGHILLGYNLSLISVMGVIGLSGIVVNDSLIMIDYANRQRRDDGAHEAIIEAGVRRFRPILLTTVTTFGGLVPMIFETSRQAMFMVPMAISLGFGILFSTSIILLMVPCFYMMVEDVVAGMRGIFGVK